MKLNKKTNKIILQKKDYEIIIYKNDYICINGNYIIKADLIEFDDLFITDKIHKGENFGYNFRFNNYLDIDDKTINISPYLTAPPQKPVRLYDLYYKTKYLDHRILTNVANNQLVTIQTDFGKIIETLQGNLTQSTTNSYQPVLIHDKNNQLLGLFMPIINRDAERDLYQLTIDLTPINEDVA